MTQEPLVSVITLSYNTGKYVVKALESVKNQTYKNIESVIIDDTSSDNSVQLIDEWLKKNNFAAKFIKHPNNKGVCDTLNEAIENCKGKYITWAGDDILYPDMIAKEVAAFESAGESVGMVYGNGHIIDLDGNVVTTFLKDDFKLPDSPYIALLKLNKAFILSPMSMVRKSVFDDIGLCDPKFFQEDYYMWLRIAKKYKIIYINELLGGYRRRPDSFGKNPVYQRKLWEGAYDVLKEVKPDNNEEKNAIDIGMGKLIDKYYSDLSHSYPGFSQAELLEVVSKTKLKSLPIAYRLTLSMAIKLRIPYKYFFKLSGWMQWKF